MCIIQSFARMANFFGRDMQAHRPTSFQMRFLDTGRVRLQLGDHRYSVQARRFYFVPAASAAA